MLDTIFIITAAIILISALLTITAHNVVHALLYLVVTMLAVSLVFFILGSSFAAALQIIVYAGAIMVLFIFVTMMLHQGEKSLAQERHLFHFSTLYVNFTKNVYFVIKPSSLFMRSSIFSACMVSVGVVSFNASLPTYTFI